MIARTNRLGLAAGTVFLWVAVSPWAWGFADSGPAVANHVFMVFAFGPMAFMIAVLRPAAFASLAGGVWLAASPWVLGYATDHFAWLDELTTGALLVVLSAAAAGVWKWAPQRQGRAKRDAGPSTRATADTAG